MLLLYHEMKKEKREWRKIISFRNFLSHSQTIQSYCCWLLEAGGLLLLFGVELLLPVLLLVGVLLLLLRLLVLLLLLPFDEEVDAFGKLPRILDQAFW